MKLVFLNRYFYPDHSATSQMLSELAFSLSSQGRAVHVVTSRQRYDAPTVRLPAHEVVQGVTVHRVWTTRFGRFNLAGRALDYLTFYISAALALAWIARRGDVVIAKTDPPMMSVVAGPIARLKGARLVNWLQDIFPELAQATGLGSGAVSGTVYGIMRWVRNRSLMAAAMNVALGTLMAERLAGFGVVAEKIRVIPNWADGDVIYPVAHEANALRRDWGLSDAFVAGYSGNLGRAHEYETFLDAIALVEASPGAANIVWLFIGGGALYRQFEAEVARRGLRSVQFRPYQPRERLAESLSAADVHLVSLRPELEGLVVPSKYYGIAAAGRPAIFVGDSDGEIARSLAANHTGVTVRLGDGAALAGTVAGLASQSEEVRRMGQRARAAFERDFARDKAMARWAGLLDEVASR